MRRWIPLAAMVAMIPSSPSISFYSQTLFASSMTSEFGWSTSQFFAPVSLAFVTGGLLSPALGAIADRVGVRRLLIPGLIAYGLGAASLGALQGSWLVYAVLTVVVTITSLAQSPILYTKIVAGWVQHRLGFALALTMTGLGIGTLTIPPLTALLIEDYGWRVARVALGGLILAIALPTVIFFLPERRSGAPGTGVGAPTAGLTISLVVRTRVFWQLTVALALASIALNGVLGAFAQITAPRGLTMTEAATGLSIMASGQIIGRLVSGRLLDWVQHPLIAATWFALAALGVALIVTGSAKPQLLAGAALLGLAVGAEIEIAAYFVVRFFGLASFGTIYGSLIAAYSASAALGPLAVALAFARQRDYDPVCLTFAAALAVSALLIGTLGRYRYAMPSTGEDDAEISGPSVAQPPAAMKTFGELKI